MIVWVAGRYTLEEGKEWEIMGVFDSEEKAKEVCSHFNDFIAPLTLNKKGPEETMKWSGCYYPIN